MKGYKDRYKRLLPRKFSYYLWETCLKKPQRDIEIVIVIRKKDLLKYPHLRLRGEIIVKKDFNTSIPEIDLRFEHYFPATVRVCPSDFDARNTSPIESDISDSQIIVSSNYF